MKTTRLAFIGAGNMGSGIVQKIAQEGIPVVMVDIKEEFVQRGMDTIKKLLGEAVERKIFKPEQVEEVVGRIHGTTDMNAVADADLVIYDPERKHVLSAETHHMNVDYSCYEGMEGQGGSDIVLSRGTVIVEDGEWKGQAGAGRFLKREVARDYLK